MPRKKREDPLVEALRAGRSFTVTLPDGGAFHSMRMFLKHGQSLTFSPVTDHREVEVGDMVLARWRGGGFITHLVGEIQGDRYLIVNSVGKANGWVHGHDLLGRVTGITEPELHPGVPEMLDQLESLYRELIRHKSPVQGDSARLLSVVDDLHWYAGNIGAAKWETLPQSSSKWSFEQHLWHLLKQAKKDAEAGWPEELFHFINHAKEHIGQIAEVQGRPDLDKAL